MHLRCLYSLICTLKSGSGSAHLKKKIYIFLKYTGGANKVCDGMINSVLLAFIALMYILLLELYSPNKTFMP